MRRIVDEQRIKTVVIDSLNGYQAAMPEENSLILHIHELLQYLNRQGAATFMTVAQHGLVGDMQAPVDVTYLADTVILLRYFEAHGQVRRAMSVIKKRTGRTNPRSANIAWAEGTVGRRTAGGFQGVLRGVPTYSGNGAPLLAGEGPVSQSGASSLRALMLAPHGRDARFSVRLLKEAGFMRGYLPASWRGCTTNCSRARGLAIMADEALQNADLRRLVAVSRGAAALVGPADHSADASRRRSGAQSGGAAAG